MCPIIDYNIHIIEIGGHSMGDYLTVNEKQKYDIVKQVVNGRKAKQRAEVELNITRRHLNRLIQRYQTQGRRSFQHGNCKREPSTKIPRTIRKLIVRLYQVKYAGFNFKHFHEFLVNQENIQVSEASVRNILKEANILSPKARRSTKRALKKQLLEKQENKKLSQREEHLLKEVQLVEGKRAHPSRSRRKYAGELLQMDASQHHWFGTDKTFLHVAIDDASGEVVGAYFDHQETLVGYYEVAAQFLANKGIPVEILTDNRTIFNSGRKEKGSLSDQRTLTQYGYMCQTLGISLSTTSIPQAKGRVERLFETLQDRLISEMRLASIQTIVEANQFLIQFIPQFNQRFAFQLKDNQNVFQKLDPSMNLDHILCRHDFRTINNGHSIRYRHQTYQCINASGDIQYLPPKTVIMVIETRNKELFANYQDRLYPLKAVPKHDVYSKELDTLPKPTKVKVTYIPPLTHPWKAASYQKYLNKLAQTT